MTNFRCGRATASAVLGFLTCVALAGAAVFIAHCTALPAVLCALILGMVARAGTSELNCNAGVQFCSGALLRTAIGLIGAKLSFAQISAFGFPAILLGIGVVLLSLTLGSGIGRLLGLPPARAALSAGAVGICGASAALALSTVLPPGRDRDRQTSYTVCVVTVLSTIAMIAYPRISAAFSLSDTAAGIFLGASIHDLTQVVGAGALVSPQAQEAATFTKLVRVACLAPAVMAVGMVYRNRNSLAESERPALLPWFIIVFVVLAFFANMKLLPTGGIRAASDAATACLVMATVALGLKTDTRAMVSDGWRPLAALVAQTLLLAAVALVASAFMDV